MPIRRTIKNVVKNYSDAQVKVREATSNDPWGPSSTNMSEIADLTYNVVAFTEIMQMVWKRLNDHGKNWRHVYKALVLLDYIIKTGSEKVAQQCRENIFSIQTLKDFQYVEDGKDHGMNVREKAKQLVSLLKDEERLKNERTKALKAKERFAQTAMGLGSAPTGGTSRGMKYSTSMGSPTLNSSDPALDMPTSESMGNVTAELEAARPSTVGEEELQLQLALAMSKEEADEDDKRRKQDDIKLQMAVEQSKTEPETTQSGGTLLDMAMGNSTQTQPPLKDPWGAPPSPPPVAADPWDAPPPDHSSNAASDPWSAPAAAPIPAADPWSGSQVSAKSADPWGPPPPAPPRSNNQSPWDPVPASNGALSQSSSGAGGGIDDEFDIISSRSPAKSSTPQHSAQVDLLGGDQGVMSKNPWEMNELGDFLPPQRDTKSPADFLGANANLVNLDNLVSRPANPTNNPFALTQPTQPAPNPFGALQQNNTNRIPLNQMATSNSMGFVQQPVNSGAVPLGAQPNMNNPFM